MPSPEPFAYQSADGLCSDPYLLPVVLDKIRQRVPSGRILDAGCGNGSLAGQLAALGYQVVGVDISQEGIDIARRAYPNCHFEVMPITAIAGLGDFDAVVSTEVIEHLYDPASLVTGAFSALRPGGAFICSTPYHGWLKNVLLAVSGRLDNHWDPAFVGGHIKFFSRPTLEAMLRQAGFIELGFSGAGRARWIWKSMVITGTRP